MKQKMNPANLFLHMIFFYPLFHCILTTEADYFLTLKFSGEEYNLKLPPFNKRSDITKFGFYHDDFNSLLRLAHEDKRLVLFNEQEILKDRINLKHFKIKLAKNERYVLAVISEFDSEVKLEETNKDFKKKGEAIIICEEKTINIKLEGAHLKNKKLIKFIQKLKDKSNPVDFIQSIKLTATVEPEAEATENSEMYERAPVDENIDNADGKAELRESEDDNNTDEEIESEEEEEEEEDDDDDDVENIEIEKMEEKEKIEEPSERKEIKKEVEGQKDLRSKKKVVLILVISGVVMFLLSLMIVVLCGLSKK